MNLKFSKIDLLTLKKFENLKKPFFLTARGGLCPNLKALPLFDGVMAGRNKKERKKERK